MPGTNRVTTYATVQLWRNTACCRAPSPFCFSPQRPVNPARRPPASPLTPPQTALESKALGDLAIPGQESLQAHTSGPRAGAATGASQATNGGAAARIPPDPPTWEHRPRPPPPPLAAALHSGPLICCWGCQSSSARPALTRPRCGEAFPRAVPLSRSASCAAAPGATRRTAVRAAAALGSCRCHPAGGTAEGRAPETAPSTQSFAGRLEAESGAPAESRRAGPGSGSGQSGRGAGRAGAAAAGGSRGRGRGLPQSPCGRLPRPGRPGQSIWFRPRSSCRAWL